MKTVTQTGPAGSLARLVRLFIGHPKVEPIHPIPTPRKAPELPKWAEDWNPFVAKMPVGTMTKYLGIDMIVVRSGKAYLTQCYYGESCEFWMADYLRCEYTDARGIIQTKEFTVHEALQCLPNVKEHAPPLAGGER